MLTATMLILLIVSCLVLADGALRLRNSAKAMRGEDAVEPQKLAARVTFVEVDAPKVQPDLRVVRSAKSKPSRRPRQVSQPQLAAAA